MNLTIGVQLDWFTIAIGLVTGVLVPLISNIYPIKQALGSSLRNSLDRSRAGVDEVSI